MNDRYDVIILGAGIAGLSTAHQILKQAPTTRLLLLEKNRRAGGNLYTQEEGGFTLDWGPNGFLGNQPSTLALVEDLGITEALLPASPLAKHRFLYIDGKLKAVPTSPWSFLRTDLLSWRAKMRIFREPWLPPRREEGEESVFDFMARRFGLEVATRIISPAILGIAANDAREISIQSLFPKIAAMEKEYRSVFRGLLKSRRPPALPPAASSPSEGKEKPKRKGLMSFQQGGVGFLTQTLASHLAPHLRTGVDVTALELREGGYTLLLGDGQCLHARALVMAIPATAASALFQTSLPLLCPLLSQITYTPIRVLSFGFEKKQIQHPLNGFGFLADPKEGLSFLGALWTSSIFPPQAPADHALIRVLAHASKEEEKPSKRSDEDAAALALRELSNLLGIQGSPILTRQYTWPQAIPLYHVGHDSLVREITSILSQYPGLYLTGNAYGGIGINNCTERAILLAERLQKDGYVG